jgi:molybdopterin-guanine dinucleotide biosynthesis protein A
LTEHAEAPPELLEHLASHPYAAVRENVARHPRTPIAVLRAMAEDPSEPLWFLVACNPAVPSDLRDRLRERMKQSPQP